MPDTWGWVAQLSNNNKNKRCIPLGSIMTSKIVTPTLVVCGKAIKVLQSWLYCGGSEIFCKPISKVNFPVTAFAPPFVTLNFFSMCLSHKQGMRHMDLITKAVIHVYFHLIRNSSGRPKNSFWLYHFKRVDTHVF